MKKYIIHPVALMLSKLSLFAIISTLFSCKSVSDDIVTLETPFTIEAIEKGDVVISKGSRETVSLEYSINQGDIQKTNIKDTVIIKLNKGDKIELYGNNDKAPDIQVTPKCYIYGNVMSLLSSTSFGDLSTIESPHAFMGMFMGNTNIMLHDSKELLLPAKRLSRKCYMYMFDGCTSLTSAPELPAMRMEKACYRAMFADCANLSKAPELPAMQLAKKCYAEMFYNCPSLEEPPFLPATQLERDSYKDMFGNDSH